MFSTVEGTKGCREFYHFVELAQFMFVACPSDYPGCYYPGAIVLVPISVGVLLCLLLVLLYSTLCSIS